MILIEKKYISMNYYNAFFWNESIKWDKDIANVRGQRFYIKQVDMAYINLNAQLWSM